MLCFCPLQAKHLTCVVVAWTNSDLLKFPGLCDFGFLLNGCDFLWLASKEISSVVVALSQEIQGI